MDVMDLLVETLRHAVKMELSAVGTDTLLAELVLGDTDAGAAIAPGCGRPVRSAAQSAAGRAAVG
jgi:hypothetical protein